MSSLHSPIVRFSDVVKQYPGAAKPALNVKSFDIKRGEFFSILGPSGSGKTTALRLMAGFESANTGQIHIAERDVTNVPAHRREINTVFQSYALFPHMTVQENVEYPLKMASVTRDEAQRRALEALEQVSMRDFAQRYPHQMSGGQRQRVALARAFVGRPKVLLLDEPLSALDLGLRLQMQHMLVELQRHLDITFVYVTHDQSEALSMSNRVAVINDGIIQQLDTPHAIYYQPSNRFVAQFIGKSNLVKIDVDGSASTRSANIAQVRFPLPQATSNGSSQLSIRFESLAITKADQPAPHPVVLPGRITDLLFLGTACEVKVQCGNTHLIALVPAQRNASLQSGDAILASFDPNDCVVFHE
ncbi:ABC transporter ATP-binding protein [Pseudomonas putida]|uniref:ABC transporter ATP-binding protein n=1 Tax=Pseudomonas putida TaxID=303 RepID=UPI00300F324B